MDTFTNRVKSNESCYIQVLIGCVTIGGYFNVYLINLGTNQLTKALSIFPHKVNGYVCKLFGLRTVLLIMGSLTHHLIAVYYRKNYEIFTIVSLCSIFLNRMTLLIVLYKSLSLSFYFFIISTLEAFVSGFFQNSLFATVPEHTTTIILSIDITVILTIGSKLIICYFCKQSDLTSIKVETWISISINIVSIGMLAFYIFYYYYEYVKTYDEAMKKLEEILEDSIKINSCLREIENIDKILSKIIQTINEIIKLDVVNVIDKKLQENNNIIEELKNKLKGEDDELNSKNDYKNSIETAQNKSQEICSKIEKFKDFYEKKRKIEYHNNYFKKVEQVYKDIEKLPSLTKEIDETMGQMDTKYKQPDQIKLTIRELNVQVENINKIVKAAEINNKRHYINMLNEIKMDNKKFLSIKNEIDTIKKNRNPNHMLEKTKPEIAEIIDKLNFIMKKNENNYFICSRKSIHKYVIILVASMFKDFLNPNIIPKSILESEKCNMIEEVSGPFYFIASLVVVCLHHNIEINGEFKQLDVLAALDLIPFVIFVMTLTGIHSKLSVFKKILNSQYKVLSLTTLLIISFRIVESYSYISISDFIEWVPEYNYSVCALTLHHFLTVVYSYLFNKVSAGYTETIISLGYTVPFIQPRNKQPTTVWYLLKNTLKSTFKNCMFDLRMNIRELI